MLFNKLNKGVFGNFSCSFLRFPSKLLVFEEHSPVAEIKPRMHIRRVYGHRR